MDERLTDIYYQGWFVGRPWGSQRWVLKTRKTSVGFLTSLPDLFPQAPESTATESR